MEEVEDAAGGQDRVEANAWVARRAGPWTLHVFQCLHARHQTRRG
jgi:hypothetical protein